MDEMGDMELLAEYAANQSERAFAALVHRYLNLVYSAALRQVGNAQLAEEIAQAVFTILAQKAHRLGKATILSGWLYRTTRFAAMAALRTERRRKMRETEFMQTQPIQSEGEADLTWEQIAPLLDKAMNELAEKDRNAVVLHYFQKKSLREVGQTMGTSEDAAQKRVSRAIAKLRSVLARREAMISADALTALLSAQTVQAAPAGSAVAIATSAILKGSSIASTSPLINETLKLMFWTKTKTTLAAAAVVLLAVGVTTAVLYPQVAKKTRPPELQGAWEGALEDNGRTLRLVVKVSKPSARAYSATLDSIEQGARDIPVSEISYSNTTVHFAIKSISGNFQGEMNPNGSEIAGTWQQLGMSFPLTLKRTDKPASLDPPLPMSAYLPRPGSDLQGYWIGNLPQGEARLLRIALKISEPTNGTFTAVFDLVDQGLRDLPVAGITYAKPHLTFDMAASKAHFEGELNAEANEISGQWRQWRGKPVPLVFSRADPKEDQIQTGSYAYSNETEPQGFWAGTLKISGNELHLLLKIGKTEAGAFTSTLDSIDQGAKDIPTTKTICTNSEVRLEWQGLSASYYGKVENGRLFGTWQQGPASFQLDFVRTNLNTR